MSCNAEACGFYWKLLWGGVRTSCTCCTCKVFTLLCVTPALVTHVTLAGAKQPAAGCVTGYGTCCVTHVAGGWTGCMVGCVMPSPGRLYDSLSHAQCGMLSVCELSHPVGQYCTLVTRLLWETGMVCVCSATSMSADHGLLKSWATAEHLLHLLLRLVGCMNQPACTTEDTAVFKLAGICSFDSGHMLCVEAGFSR